MSDKQEKFIEALRKKYGTIKTACEAVPIARSTYYEWMKEADFKQAVDDTLEELIDNAESKLHELINGVTMMREVGEEERIYTKAPDSNSIQFFLKMKAKHRGYVEKLETENTNKSENKLKIVIDYGDNTTSE